MLGEFLAALNIAHQVNVTELVKKLSHKLNLGIIIVIHDINLTLHYCNHLVIVHGNNLLTEGDGFEIAN